MILISCVSYCKHELEILDAKNTKKYAFLKNMVESDI